MVKMVTSAEYLPPLPEQVPEEAFPTFERWGGIKLGPEQRGQVDEAVYGLVDGKEEYAARPNAGDLRRRRARLVRLLEREDDDPSKFAAEIHDILECDTVGEVLASLLMPPCPWEPHIRTLTGDALENRRRMLLKAALDLQLKAYEGQDGRERDGYVDRYVQKVVGAYRAAKGRRGPRGDCDALELLFIGAVAEVALRTFDPKHAERPRWLAPEALEERVRVVTSATRRAANARRARRYNAKRRARS